MPYDSPSGAKPAVFKPYIPAGAHLPEMTLRALVMGVVLYCCRCCAAAKAAAGPL